MANLNNIKKSYPSFESYIQAEFIDKINEMKAVQSSLNDEQLQLLTYLQNNHTAIKNTLQNYSPSEEIRTITSKIKAPLDIYIIMENWCGSSAANVPLIVNLLKTLPFVNINIVPRDTNEEFMDNYLSNGKRSIPKVIAFDNNLNEHFVWGSASKMQEEYAEIVKAKNLAFPDFIKEMQAWFKDNNTIAIEQDFKELLKK